jgi:hypothetical protein
MLRTPPTVAALSLMVEVVGAIPELPLAFQYSVEPESVE